MTIDELRALKDKLEREQRYSIIMNVDFENASEPKGLLEYIATDNTDEVLHKSEQLFENTLRRLVEIGIPFDQIGISSSIGFLCKESLVDLVKNLKAKYINNPENPLTPEREEEFQEKYDELISMLDKNVNHRFVPVSIALDPFITGMGDEYGFEDDFFLEKARELGFYDGFNNECISGIVKFPKFISRLKDLGYDVKLNNYGECESFDDIIKDVVEHDFDTSLIITADFGRKKRKIDEPEQVIQM